MSTPSQLKTISIVGGGFTGSSIAVQQVAHYAALARQGHALPPLTIRLIDEHGSEGPGLPYATQDDVFVLNQPASAMSPFPDDPDHFTRWLGDRGDVDTFAPRGLYGTYLKENLHRAFADAATQGLTITLETVRARVDDIAFKTGNTVLHLDDGTQISSNVVVLATGHQRSGFLRKFEPTGRCFAPGCSVEDVRRVLDDAGPENEIAIVGTGQSMADALAVLDKIGYKGLIHAFSRHGVAPWAYRPENYRSPKPPYAPVFLDPARISAKRAWTFNTLRARLEREFRRAGKLGYDVGHVLGAIDLNGLRRAGPGGTEPEGFTGLHHLWKKIYGNPTTPERYALFQSYKDSGQLVLAEAEIRENDIIPCDDGFILHHKNHQLPLHIKALFNAAAFSFDPLAAPLLQNLHEGGHLYYADGSVTAGVQKNSRLFVAGPPTSPHKWGVETFRNANAETAKKSVETVLNQN